MAVALSLHFDRAMADAVRAVWTALAEAGASREMLDLGYPPHLTLVVAEDESLAPVLVGALRDLAPLVPLSMALGDVCQFEGTSVTWLSYAADRAQLDQLHRAATGTVPLDLIHPHYRPGAWTPHATLALNGDAETLLSIAREAWVVRLDGCAARLEVARFPPAAALAGIDLPSA